MGQYVIWSLVQSPETTHTECVPNQLFNCTFTQHKIYQISTTNKNKSE